MLQGASRHLGTIGAVFDGHCRFALARTEVVQLRTTNGSATLHFDLRDARRVEWKYTFNALAVRNTADSEVFVDPGALAPNHDAGVNLDTLLVTLNNASVDFDRVSDVEGGCVGLELFGFDFLNDSHFL